MAEYSRHVLGKIVVLCTFILYYMAFFGFGITALISDSSVRSDPCGKSTHVWKYCFLNTIIAGGIFVSFLIFPGGGEGARARALMITILHLAFVVWGVLLWSEQPSCLDVVRNKFIQIYTMYAVLIWHNTAFFIFYILHEMWLGKYCGGDLTLLPEASVRKSSEMHNFIYAPIADHSPKQTQQQQQQFANSGISGLPPTALPGTAMAPNTGLPTPLLRQPSPPEAKQGDQEGTNRHL